MRAFSPVLGVRPVRIRGGVTLPKHTPPYRLDTLPLHLTFFMDRLVVGTVVMESRGSRVSLSPPSTIPRGVSIF